MFCIEFKKSQESQLFAFRTDFEILTKIAKSCHQYQKTAQISDCLVADRASKARWKWGFQPDPSALYQFLWVSIWRDFEAPT